MGIMPKILFDGKFFVAVKTITTLQLNSQKWIPWRVYAAILLWNINFKETG